MVEIVKTSDGSHTIFVPELGEHYHSVHGAIQESSWIYINSGLEYSRSDRIRIFEVGFGTGLNAFLTCMNVIDKNKEVFYTSIEKYPLTESVTGKLNYKRIIGIQSWNVFEKIHACKWNESNSITDNFSLIKLAGDLTTDELGGSYNLIYFDAFGPDKQPEMWSDEVFKKISEITEYDGVLVTYSAKGTVQRALKRNGFKLTLLPGPPGKRHFIRAIKS